MRRCQSTKGYSIITQVKNQVSVSIWDSALFAFGPFVMKKFVFVSELIPKRLYFAVCQRSKCPANTGSQMMLYFNYPMRKIEKCFGPPNIGVLHQYITEMRTMLGETEGCTILIHYFTFDLFGIGQARIRIRRSFTLPSQTRRRRRQIPCFFVEHSQSLIWVTIRSLSLIS